MSDNINNKIISNIYLGNINIVRIMQGENLVWGEAYSPPEEPPYARPSDLLLWYDFTKNTNESSDRETIIDLSGNDNHGTLHNFSFNEESGYVENGLRFDGVEDFLTFNDITFNREDDLTIEIRMEEIVGNLKVALNEQNEFFKLFKLYVSDSGLSMWNGAGNTHNRVSPKHSQENHFVFIREDTMAIALNNGEYSTLFNEQHLPKKLDVVGIFHTFWF